MKRNYLTLSVVLCIFGIVILITGGVFFISQMQNSIREQTVSSILEITEQGANSFNSYIDQGTFMLENRARNMSKFSSADSDGIGRKLDTYEEGSASFSCLDLTEGIIYYNSEMKNVLPAEKLEEYRSLPDHGLVAPFLAEYNGQRVIGYFLKFKFANDADGMLLHTLPVSEFVERFSLSFYDGAGFNYIVNSSGDIMLRSNSETGNRTFSNIFDVISLDNNSAADVETFRASMADDIYGVMKFSFNGSDYVFAFVPLEGTDNWYLISVIPDKVISEQTNRMLMTMHIFVLLMVVAASVLISLMLAIAQYRRQQEASKTEILYREQLFDLLVESSDDVFIMLASDGKRVEYVSPNAERALGVSVEAIERDVNKVQEVLHIDGNDAEPRDILSVPFNKSISFEGGFVHPVTGDRRWFVETIYHTVIKSTERYIVVLADRTEDRQKESVLTEALQIANTANNSKSTFLSNISHDMRTPMNAIVGYATLLEHDINDPERVLQHARKITSSSQYLLGMINDVLDMSKIESGKTELNIAPFGLPELVEELGVITQLQAQAKKQNFEIQVKDVHDEYLMGDKLRINQIMINILSNAVKYTPVGGTIVMTVQQMNSSASDIARIRFTVKDNGIGMSEEFRQNIFQPFAREVSSIVNEIQGTGLGMTITKNLVDLMGGTISVESQAGKGSTFIIDFGLKVADNSDDENFWEKNNIKSMLVVDDEQDVCTAIVTAMLETDVAVESAHDGQAAIDMVSNAHAADEDFDVVLLDWKMPGMNGIETARKIREVVPADIQIIVLTSYDIDAIREEGIQAGIDKFLPKPFFLSTFKEVIRSAEAELSGVRKEASLEGGNGLQGRHFLYAEDNDLNAAILNDLLEVEGATLERAVNGQEAVDIFLEMPSGTYDAILMDVQMPVMNGHDAARAIRVSDSPEATTIPIVALTANAFADDVQQALNAGMNAHVSKPVDMRQLTEILVAIWNS